VDERSDGPRWLCDDDDDGGQGLSLVRERSQSLDLPSGTLSQNISVVPPPITVLNVAPKFTILIFNLICLRLFIDSEMPGRSGMLLLGKAIINNLC